MQTDPTDEVPLDLEMLMTMDPLKLTKVDRAQIIEYHRRIRAQREAGKGRKAGPAAAKPASVAALLAKKPSGPVNRRGF